VKFRYKKFGPGILRPIIPIGVEYEGSVLMYEVLVDSGADICIFDAEIGEALGLDIESGARQDVAGLTGVSESYFIHEVTLRVGGHPYRVRVGFMSSMGQYGHGIVGQIGFFDRYIVKFDYAKEEIELKERVR
jgi:hypothetical protein